ncbi:hypothetical protein C8J56DRAFT_1157423 [Mycena floridula]|nr:hypothetical protein C8J56DRAFT_1157423 [Mycena floridula]
MPTTTQTAEAPVTNNITLSDNGIPEAAPSNPPPTAEQTAHAGSGAHPDQVPFKDRVIGAAQKTRGTLLGKPDLKAHGQQIIDGEVPAEKPQ